MYRVVYKYVHEIEKSCTVIGEFSGSDIVYECIVVDGEKPTAVPIKTGLPLIFNGKQSLKHLVRCYIINESDTMNEKTLSEIIDRYR